MALGDDEYDPIAEEAHWLAVTAERPYDAEAWYNLGLARKYRADWQGSVEANQRAVALNGRAEDPAWWNLGIAATALRDWQLARKAWHGYGMTRDEIPDGNGPLELNWGLSPLRIFAPDGHPEVVWGRRMCPARMRITNVPFPTSGHRWGDIMLHDGAPNGERTAWGRTYSVFDALERWSPSEIPTLEVDVRCSHDEDAQALIDALQAAHFDAEDWTANVRALCATCSEGTICGDSHPRLAPGADRHFGLAAPLGLARDVLRAWRDEHPATRDFDEPVATG